MSAQTPEVGDVWINPVKREKHPEGAWAYILIRRMVRILPASGKKTGAWLCVYAATGPENKVAGRFTSVTDENWKKSGFEFAQAAPGDDLSLWDQFVTAVTP